MYWLRFGLLALLVVKTVMGFSLLSRRFSGKSARLETQDYEYRVTRHKKRVQEVQIAVAVPDRLRFIMRREGRFDRIAKWLGIAHEWQTGDARFDDSIYVLCDDPLMLRALSLDAELRDAVLEAVGTTSGGILSSFGGKLALTDRATRARAGKGTADPEVGRMAARNALQFLLRIRERLASVPTGEWSHERDPGLTWQFAIVATTTTLGILSVGCFFWTQGIGEPRQLAFDRIETLAALIGAGAGIVLMLMLMRLMSGTSRVHLVLLEILLVGIPGAWFVSRTVLAEINQRSDEAPAILHQTQVVNQYVVKGRRGGRSYYLVINRWPAQAADLDTTLRVDRDLYAVLGPGTCITFVLHPGHLGDLWLSEIRPSCEPLPEGPE